MSAIREINFVSHPSVDILPTELLLLIFEHASYRNGDYVDVENVARMSEGQSQLATCALVCHRWSTIVPRVLYRDIVLSRTDLSYSTQPARKFGMRVHQLERTLKSAPTFAGFVDFLHIDVGRQAQYGDAYEEIRGHDDDFATLTDIARLIRVAPRLRHISLTIESTPFGVEFTTEDLQGLATVASTMRHFTFRDFRPICHGDGDEQQPQLIPQGGGEEFGIRRDLTSNDVLLQCLQSWPSIALLSICGSHSAEAETENDTIVDLTALALPTLQALRVHGHASLPPLATPHLESTEWINPTAEVFGRSRSRVIGTDHLSCWDLEETLDLSNYHTVLHLRLDCAHSEAWKTLNYLPPAVSQLVVSGIDAECCLQQLELAVGTSQSLRKIVLLDNSKSRHQNFVQTPLPERLVSLCRKRGVEIAHDFEVIAFYAVG